MGSKEQVRFQNRLRFGKKGILLDPVNQNNYYGLANAYYYNKQYKKAETLIKESLDLNPNQEYSYFLLATLLQMQGRYDEALVYTEKEPIEGFMPHSKARIYHLNGNQKEADKVFTG